MINRSEPQQFQQFAANFISSVDEVQTCDFAAFVPSGESTPLQVSNHACIHLSIDKFGAAVLFHNPLPPFFVNYYIDREQNGSNTWEFSLILKIGQIKCILQ